MRRQSVYVVVVGGGSSNEPNKRPVRGGETALQMAGITHLRCQLPVLHTHEVHLLLSA